MFNCGSVWHSVKEGGYLGAYLREGFASPVLLRLAEELRAALPGVFGEHQLTQLWAYKYAQRSPRGTALHADQAAVNVNLWITPDDANLEEEGGGAAASERDGGMAVYDVPPPGSWGMGEYNSVGAEAQARIRRFLRESGARREQVPHRANRVVIFDSTLFHESSEHHFKPGYKNRRINITLLFGKKKTASGS